MTETDPSSFDVVELAVPALAFAVGALVAGFAALTAWSTAYMNANPAVGSVSGDSTAVVAVFFLGGVATMFLAAFVALHRVLVARE